MTSIAVVLAVGAKLNGHASFGTRTFKTTSLCFATVDFGFPVMAITFTANRFNAGSK